MCMISDQSLLLATTIMVMINYIHANTLTYKNNFIALGAHHCPQRPGDNDGNENSTSLFRATSISTTNTGTTNGMESLY